MSWSAARESHLSGVRTIAIPLFALTEVGEELVIERAKEIETSVLINTMPLPVLPEQKQPAGWEL